MYFKFFKDFNYTLNNKEYSFVDIFKRVAFSTDTLNNKKVFTDHYVVDGESLESLALKYYNDASMSWMILLSNSFASMDEFPQSMENIVTNAERKYSGLAVHIPAYLPDIQPGDVMMAGVLDGFSPRIIWNTTKFAIIKEYNSLYRFAVVDKLNGGLTADDIIGFQRLLGNTNLEIGFTYSTGANPEFVKLTKINKIENYKDSVYNFIDENSNYRSPYYINDSVEIKSSAQLNRRLANSDGTFNGNSIGFTNLDYYQNSNQFTGLALSCDGITKGNWSETWGDRIPRATVNGTELPSSTPGSSTNPKFTPGGGITYTGSSIILSTKPQKTNIGTYTPWGFGRAELRNELPFSTPAAPSIVLRNFNFTYTADVKVKVLVQRNFKDFDLLGDGTIINTAFNKVLYMLGFYKYSYSTTGTRNDGSFYFGPRLENFVGFINDPDDTHWGIMVSSDFENNMISYLKTNMLLTDRHTFKIEISGGDQIIKFYIDDVLQLTSTPILSTNTVYFSGAAVAHGFYDTNTTSAQIEIFSMNSTRTPLFSYKTNVQNYIYENDRNRIIKILKPKYIPVVRGAIQELITSNEIKTKVIEIVG